MPGYVYNTTEQLWELQDIPGTGQAPPTPPTSPPLPEDLVTATVPSDPAPQSQPIDMPDDFEGLILMPEEVGVKSIEPKLLQGDDIRYDHAGDAHMRLTNTIVRFDGLPYYIKSISPHRAALAWDMIEGSKDIQFDVNDVRLEISSPNIGFINTAGRKKNVYYPMRGPVRSQKQGLDVSRLKFYNIAEGKFSVMSFHDFTDFRRMLVDDYVSMEEATKEGLPMSRTWAFARTKDPSVLLVFHKNYPVAFYVPSESRFMFRNGGLTRFRRNSLQRVLSKKGDFNGNYQIDESFRP